MTRIEDLWREIATQSARTGLFRRVDETHPLDIYAGIDHRGKRVLLLVSREVPANLPPPGIVEVLCNQRENAEWAIIVQLARPDFDELFGRLCQDLIDATRDARPSDGPTALLSRLSRWRRLLEIGYRRTLSEVELRGLIGELWFLLTIVLPRLGPDAAIKGWLGPLAAPHDFLVDTSIVEIKTSVPGSSDITITSLQQLDAQDEPLILASIALAPSTQNTPDALTTSSLVTSIRQSIESSRFASTEFELRLAEVGYVDGEEYTRAWYHISGIKYFHVRDDFPRLIPSLVPNGIRQATYVIDLHACAPFELDFSAKDSLSGTE